MALLTNFCAIIYEFFVVVFSNFCGSIYNFSGVQFRIVELIYKFLWLHIHCAYATPKYMGVYLAFLGVATVTVPKFWCLPISSFLLFDVFFFPYIIVYPFEYLRSIMALIPGAHQKSFVSKIGRFYD